MATSTFTGASGTGNLATAGNWSGSALPAGGNDVVIGSTDYDLYGSIAGNDVASIKVNKGWRGRFFGTAANPVIFQCSGASGVDLNFGANFQGGNIQSTTSTTAKMRVQSVAGGVLVYSSGTTTTMYGSETGGALQIGASAVVTNIFVNAMKAYAYAGTAFTKAVVGLGGLLETERNVTTGYNYATLRGLLTATATSIYNGPNSVLNWRSTGTITLAEFMAAALSLDKATGDFTITTATYDKRSVIPRIGEGMTVTITNDNPY